MGISSASTNNESEKTSCSSKLPSMSSTSTKKQKKHENSRNSKKSNNERMDGACAVCSTGFTKDDCSISCFACTEWFHIACGNLDKCDFDVITRLGERVEWFCEACSRKKGTKNSGIATKCQNSIDASCKNMANVCQEFEVLKNDVTDAICHFRSEINDICSNIDSSFKKNQILYSDALKNSRSDTVVSSIIQPTPQKGELYTLLVKGVDVNDSCKRRTDIMEKIRSLFPRLRLINAYLSPKGLIIIKVDSSEDRDRVVSEWKKSYFGTSTNVVVFDPNKRASYSIIAKQVPVSVVEASILNELKASFKSVAKVERFRRDGQPMTTVKVDFSNESDMVLAIQNGIYIGDCFFRPENYRPSRQPLRCFNCNKFGHTTKVCRNKETCAKCSKTGHRHDNCQDATLKCVNCSGSHATFDKKCPTYIEMYKKLNFLV